MHATPATKASTGTGAKAAVVAVDLHRGHLDPAVATMPVPPDQGAALLERVIARTREITIGDTVGEENAFMGAVIDRSAFGKISEYIEIGRGEGKVVVEKAKIPGKGHFIAPVIIDGVKPDARSAQEEIFGPVLAVIPVDSFDEGLAVANGTQYGLTGALYSNNRLRLERARHEFHVGNLYLNRKCTGALVDVQPFGGFNMSGTNSKAGGRDYIQMFLQGKSITEKL